MIRLRTIHLPCLDQSASQRTADGVYQCYRSRCEMSDVAATGDNSCFNKRPQQKRPSASARQALFTASRHSR
jgi:hypothetical protein